MGEDHPDRWGKDSLSALLDQARGHEFAAFECQPKHFALLAKVDAAFDTASDSLPHSRDWFPGLLLLSGHRAFRAGAHLVLSGFAPESYACSRLVLEYSLASLHLAKHPDSQVVWMSRHDDDARRAQVRSEFSYRSLLRELRDLDPTLAHRLSVLYERTIDRGAHPNERALTQVLEIEERPGQKTFGVAHLCGDGPPLVSALRTLTQSGVCGLDVFSAVYSERFTLTGVQAALAELKPSL